jgi:hypothetical protein
MIGSRGAIFTDEKIDEVIKIIQMKVKKTEKCRLYRAASRNGNPARRFGWERWKQRKILA